jgi:murein DD-endopeptidase MepM/ murein hydrolase activator NlpD
MSTLAAYASWLTKAPPREEIIAGLRRFPRTASGADLAAPQSADHAIKPNLGGYAEDRSIYSQKLFAPEGEEPRTLHLGLDIFAPADTTILAPMMSRVHSVADNAHPGDYGPTLILEHAPASGLVFFTLYGHLAKSSTRDLKRGQAFMPGEPIAGIGKRYENGGWPPHLHFQIILDIGDWKGDFPGVCRASEREAWLARCPDPRPLLGL